jgi:hypothetical protein
MYNKDKKGGVSMLLLVIVALFMSIHFKTKGRNCTAVRYSKVII